MVNDGDSNSNTATTTISVSAANDAPALDLDANDDNDTGNTTGFQTSFTEGGGAVSIAETDTDTTDADDTKIEGATITLTKAHTADALAAGTLPSGLTVAAVNSTATKVVLTGSATLADYETAIKAITFNYTS